MQSLKASQAKLVSLITQLMADVCKRISWFTRSEIGTTLLTAMAPCVHETESGSQFLTEILTDEPNLSGDLKRNESDLQVVSQKVVPVVALLEQDVSKTKAMAAKKNIFIKLRLKQK